MNDKLSPGLYLVATPIGNMEDCSDRIKRYLTQADLIACEDTREMKKMLSMLHVEREPKDIFSVHEHNELQMADRLIELIIAGKSIAYSSDAGMPSISDPGQILVDKALDAELFVSSAPGATAVTTAVALSGFVGSGFCFEGFFPRSRKEQDSALDRLEQAKQITVFYESPKRLSSTLNLLKSRLGVSARATVCRELTKKFEQIKRGTLEELIEEFNGEIKGECVIVLEGQNLGNKDPSNIELDNLEKTIQVLKNSGLSSRDAVQALSFITDVPKNRLKEIFLNT